MNTGRRQTARNLLVAATQRPWRWGDWGVVFGEHEREGHRLVLEYNPTHGRTRELVRRLHTDGPRMVLRLEEPIDSEADALLLVEAPVLLEEALDEIDRLEKQNALLGERPTRILEDRIKTLEKERDGARHRADLDSNAMHEARKQRDAAEATVGRLYRALTEQKELRLQAVRDLEESVATNRRLLARIADLEKRGGGS